MTTVEIPTDPSTYRTGVLSQEIFHEREYLLCGREACRKVLVSPYQAICGHRLCKTCIEYYRGLDPQFHKCDACDRESIYYDAQCSFQQDPLYPLDVNSMIEDKAMAKEIRNLPCTCMNPGCNAPMMSLSRYQNHISRCQYRLEHCKDCNQEYVWNEKNYHTCIKLSSSVR